MLKVGLVLAGVWLFVRRFGVVFCVYGCLLAVLIILGGRKSLIGLSRGDYADSVSSPMSLLRWGLLGLSVAAGSVVPRAACPPSRTTWQLGAGAAALVVLCMASSAYALNPQFSLMRGTSLLLLVAALAWTFYPTARDAGRCHQLLQLYQFAALAVVAVNLYLLIQGRGFVLTHLGMARFGGLLENPIQMSTFAVLTAPSCLLMARERGWLSWHGALVVGLVVSLVLTHARAGLLAAMIGVVLFRYLVEDSSRRQLWVALAVLLSPLFLTMKWMQVLAREQGGSFWEVLYNARMSIWVELFKHFKTSPWLGHGFGCSHLFNRYVIKDATHADMHVHNSYLEVFGDLGALGVVLLGVLIFWVWQHGRKSLRATDRRVREMNAAIFATVVSCLVDAAADSWLLSVGNNSCVMFWVMVAALVARADCVVESQTARADSELAASPMTRLVEGSRLCPLKSA